MLEATKLQRSVLEKLRAMGKEHGWSLEEMDSLMDSSKNCEKIGELIRRGVNARRAANK